MSVCHLDQLKSYRLYREYDARIFSQLTVEEGLCETML